ncbi:MAG: exodeoxyribonuclease small subunit [Hyphomicrobiales bacterium]|nr:exodeoxyribonuclease small subunit [Hyphomicrobiales bacterium]
MSDIPPEISALPFEEALRRLEEIVGQLETGQVSLEKSIEIYETGNHLRAHCESLLKGAEARIEKITVSANGQPKGTEPLDVD